MEIIELNLSFRATTERKTTNRIILHHSGVSILQNIDIIHNYHKNTNKWAGIGYHFYVRKDGSIYRGRPENTVGAHAYGANSDSIGICAEGDFNKETMNDVQKNAIKELVAYLKKIYNITKVQRHSDTISTSCPGVNYPFYEIINEQVSSATQTVVKVDEEKERIKELQSLLNKIYNSGLAVDGIIGNLTNNALRRVVLRNYSDNDLVKFVQRRLIMNGHGVGNCGVDGKYGKDTENAVRKFQSQKGLVVDGIAGINTIKALV